MNQQKNWQYIGVFAKEEKETQKILLNLTKDSLNNLYEQYKEKELELMLNNINKYTFPRSMHMTTLFAGKNKNLRNHEAIQNFKTQVEVNLIVHGLAISPENIVAAILSKEDYNLYIDNQYPHMTTLLGKMAAKDSNIILQEVFNQVDYGEVSSIKENNKYWRIEGDKKIIYVVLFKQKIIIPGSTNYA